MPTYTYACAGCAEQLEVVQRITDDALTRCPTCDGELRKVFQPVGVVFKGSGFYRNDSRSTSKANGSAGSGEKDSGKTSGKESSDSTGSSGSSESSGSSGSSDSSTSSTSGTTSTSKAAAS